MVNTDNVTRAAGVVVRVAVDPDGIHDELKKFDHWVVWKAEPKKDSDKVDKVLYNPRTKRKASSRDSRTWGSFDEIVAAYVRNG